MRFPTYTIFLTAVLALVIIAAMSPFWIRLLKSRGIGQNVRVDGPQGHLLKEGTPTMGGVLILTTVVITFLLMGRLDKVAVIALTITIACGLLGLVDDASKILRERSLGVTARYKLSVLSVISIVVGLLAVNYAGLSSNVAVPLTDSSLAMGRYAFSLSVAGTSITVPWIYLVFLILLIVGTANTVNLTDGLDGLAAGTVTIVMLAYAGIAFRQG
ncbi:hypothetical protein LCGC14_3086280, partial [marine sediment metagenome]